MFCEIKQKVTSINDTFIDNFEHFINVVQRKICDYNIHHHSKGYVKYKLVEGLEDGFESVVQKLRNLVLETNKDAKNQLSKKKQYVLDNFESFVRILQDNIDDIDFKVKKQVNNLKTVKSDVIEHFENVRQNLNDKQENMKHFVVSKKTTIVSDFDDLFDDLKLDVSHAHQIIERKKNEFVDEFEEVIENTKWIVADRKSNFVEGAERVFDDIRDQLESLIEEGKHEIEEEVESISYAMKMGESVLNEFVQFCECTASEFFQFSDKRAVTLIQDGTKIMKMFYNEVIDSLVRGYEEKLLCDNLVLEINSSRYAYNVSMSEVNFHVVRALLTLPQPDGNAWPQLVARLVYFTPILTNYIRSPTAQQDCLLAIEDVAGSNKEVFDCIVKLIHWLYEQDILSEEAILDWYHHPNTDSDMDNTENIRMQVLPFIKWLKEAEEESEEGESDSDSVD